MQGSPNDLNLAQETFRHALAVTAVRPIADGTPYLYTLNLSCRWHDLAWHHFVERAKQPDALREWHARLNDL